MFMAAFSTVGQKVETPKSVPQLINKMWYIYSREHYSAIKRHVPLIHAITWMNTENMLSERSHTQKTTHCMIPFMESRNVWNRKICTDGKWIRARGNQE